ncbi:MAG TPA: aldehyde dehydrogenase family protein [Lacipirellulaceae bacterium]|jgi:aldehyde dehydrogenase (NAD+)|nr:aldehyde dehydrogenase family protein [Lacipirellulaceae bacterium]
MDRRLEEAFKKLGIDQSFGAIHECGAEDGKGAILTVRSPIDGSTLAEFAAATPEQVNSVIATAAHNFPEWRNTPAPVRGELVRRIGNAFREQKNELATLVAWETGKILPEALGEVQEMIDICDFAVGVSRQLYGKTIASERPGHRLTEYWHPLGPVGVISAFNFPVAVWAWNAMIGFVCGDPIVWKPSEKTPLSAIACQQIVERCIRDASLLPHISSVVIGGADVGHALAASPKLPLISATGSVPMGRKVAQTVAARLGRSLLELGGNNGMIVSPSADLNLAVRSIVFAAAGTCGQRCTTLRRLIVHDSIADELRDRIIAVYKRLAIGDPTKEGVLVGPLVDKRAFDAMEAALVAAREQGGKVHGGSRVTEGVPAGGYYVRPAVVEISADAPILQQETFAPILYVVRYRELEEAVCIHNNVPQGLSSAILTRDVLEAELFTSAAGSDCGIANVNVGTSGAEIGGAFGGEKETGGGRESGSDSWKAYMRRVTSTVNYSDDLPLAQGIKFDV